MISDLVGYSPYPDEEDNTQLSSKRLDSNTNPQIKEDDEEQSDYGIPLTDAQLFIQILEKTLEFYSCVERLIPVDLMNRVGKEEMDSFLTGYIAPLMGKREEVL